MTHIIRLGRIQDNKIKWPDVIHILSQEQSSMNTHPKKFVAQTIHIHSYRSHADHIIVKCVIN